MATLHYPVRVDASLDGEPSRWLWLVKWLLLVPHYLVLAFLWLAFVVLSVVAFVAILVTGRYPRSIFEFNVGVLRWAWRVNYYGYAALATDRYPPFTLADVPDYPAHLEIQYPQRLSRGLVLVKWWLLVLPHYVVLAVFAGGAIWGVTTISRTTDNPAWSVGLITLLSLFAAIGLLCTGRYPRGIFDFVLGMDRWVLRVAAYTALLTDDYPPFRLDVGGGEPAMTPPTDAVPATGTGTGTGGWTGGRIASVVIGVVVGLAALASLGAGGTALWADRTMRDTSGFVWTSAETARTDGYAITTGSMDFAGGNNMLGDVRLRVTPRDPADTVFVGVAPSDATATYLDGVEYTTVTGWDAHGLLTSPHPGGAPARQPGDTAIWTATTSGPGTQVLTWTPTPGRWTFVVMNADGARGVATTADVAATLPVLAGAAAGLLAFGVVALAGSVLLVAVPVRRASTRTDL